MIFGGEFLCNGRLYQEIAQLVTNAFRRPEPLSFICRHNGAEKTDEQRKDNRPKRKLQRYPSRINKTW